MNYTNDDISALRGAERIRTRPASMLGSNGLDGVKHCIKEIIGNSLDEASSGFGDKIIVTLYEDNSISVRDFGRGVPMGYNKKENDWNWRLIFEELYAGGKYNNNQDLLKEVKDWERFDYKSIPYLFSVGLNGVGSSAVQYTSEFFNVISYRDGKASEMHFVEGTHIWDELKVYDTNEPNGTFVHWKSDSRVHEWGQVFTNSLIESKWLSSLCKQVSISAEIEVEFVDKVKNKTTVYSKSSIKEYLEKESEEDVAYKELLHHNVEKYQPQDSADYITEVQVCLSKVAMSKGGCGFSFFHNNIAISGGVHLEAFMTALNLFVNDLGLGKVLKQSDYLHKFSVIVSSYSNIASYRNQTKDSLDNMYVFEAIKNTIRSLLAEAWSNKEKWVLNAIQEAKDDAEMRLQLEAHKKQIKEAVKATKSRVKPDKFVSCRSYEKGRSHEVELFLLEGDSASGSFKMARDSDYQCFIPLKGKGLNVYKATTEKIFQNEEVLSIMNVLGCGVDLDIEGEQLFDISKLKVGKIIFLSDADVDGLHIRMLMFLLIYKLFPTLLYEDRVFVANTPRHQVWLTNGDVVFCYDDEEFNKLRRKGVVANSMRFKGLGQVNSDVLRATTIAPESRQLQSLRIDKDDDKLRDTLEILFGSSTERRKMATLRRMLGDDVKSFEDGLDKLTEEFNNIEIVDKGFEVEEVEF